MQAVKRLGQVLLRWKELARATRNDLQIEMTFYLKGFYRTRLIV